MSRAHADGQAISNTLGHGGLSPQGALEQVANCVQRHPRSLLILDGLTHWQCRTPEQAMQLVQQCLPKVSLEACDFVKPIDKRSTRERASYRAVIKVNAKVASKPIRSEG